MNLILDSTLLILPIHHPWGTQSIPEVPHIPFPKEAPSPDLPLRSELDPTRRQAKNLKGKLPEIHRQRSSLLCRRAKRCFAAFSLIHYKCTHRCAHFSYFLSPQAQHVPRRSQGNSSHGMLEGERSAVWKRCNKSTPVRERCPQKQNCIWADCFSLQKKLTLEW